MRQVARVRGWVVVRHLPAAGRAVQAQLVGWPPVGSPRPWCSVLWQGRHHHVPLDDVKELQEATR